MEFRDPYENITNKNVFYVVENIATTDTEDVFDEIFIKGCKCEDKCNLQSNCFCILKYGISYFTKENSEDYVRDLYDSYIINFQKINSGIYECNSSCKCKQKDCGNRLVQYGPRQHLEIRNCREKGFGLFTTKKIFKGCFICEYAGEVLTESEAIKRYKFNKEKQIMNYIICIREQFGEKTNVTYVDPCYFGNIGRYINHSCNPNCQLIPTRVDNTVPKVCVFTLDDIEENSELTFDYGDGRNNFMINDLKPCLCGEITCKKWLPYSVNMVC